MLSSCLPSNLALNLLSSAMAANLPRRRNRNPNTGQLTSSSATRDESTGCLRKSNRGPVRFIFPPPVSFVAVVPSPSSL